MKIYASTIIILALLNFVTNADDEIDKEKSVFNGSFEPYISIGGGVGLWNIESGGFNEECGCFNFGDDEGTTELFGLNVGTRINRFKLALGVTYLGNFQSLTSGVEGPAFDVKQYEVNADYEVLSGDFSLAYDIVSLDRTKVFIGAGIGISGIDLEASDSIWNSNTNTTNMSWQVGVGIEYSFSKALSFNVNYQFFDYGMLESDLVFGATEISEAINDGGDFTSDITSHQLKAGFTINF